MTLGRKIKERRLEKGINKPNCKRLKMIADDMGITIVELLGSDEK